MPGLYDILYRLRTLFRPGLAEREMTEEFAHHVEMEAERLVREGMTRPDAAREASRRFGDPTRERQRTRDAWGLGVVTDIFGDVRIALRQLRRRPAFTVLASVTLGLGIGATVALGSVVRGLLLRPLPVAEEEHLHVFWSQFDWRGIEFDFVRERTKAFTSLAAYSTNAFTLQTERGTSLLLGGVTSANIFDLLGTAPALGHAFAPGADRPGAEPVVVLSDGLWRQEFGSDSSVLGTRIQLDGRLATVIGVMPAGFFFPTPEYRLWSPLELDPASSNYRGNGYLTLVGRTRDGVTPTALAADLQSLAAALGERFTYPAAWDKTKDAHAVPLRAYTVGNARPVVLLLLGAVALLLLMAAANVAALVLARTTDRTPEVALRVALGARRGRLARQIITESITLSMLAAALGALLARVSFQVLVARLPLTGGLGDAIGLDWTMFATATALAGVVGVLVAAVPIQALLRGRLSGVAASRSTAASRQGPARAHGALVACEVGLAVILAVGALLLMRTVEGLSAIDPGFEPRGVLTADLLTPATGMTDAERRQFYRDAVASAAALPGVDAAALVPRLAIRDPGWQGSVESADRPDLVGPNAPSSVYRIVSPDYFRAMGLSILEGRGFDATDRAAGLPVAMVSQAFATRMWPDGAPIGRRIRTRVGGSGEWMTVVGVVEEARVFTMTGANPMALYVPAEQAEPPIGNVLVMRVSEDPVAVTDAIRARVHAIDPRVAVARVTTLEEVIDAALAEPLRLRFFLTLFAGLALVLGAVGIYGVVAYSVVRRRAEIGVRMALGAAPSRVLQEVLRTSLFPVVVGIGAGLLASLALGRSMAGFLYGVAPTDPRSFFGAALLLFLAALAAAMVPGWRAGRTSPLEALRAE